MVDSDRGPSFLACVFWYEFNMVNEMVGATQAFRNAGWEIVYPTPLSDDDLIIPLMTIRSFWSLKFRMVSPDRKHVVSVCWDNGFSVRIWSSELVDQKHVDLGEYETCQDLGTLAWIVASTTTTYL